MQNFLRFSGLAPPPSPPSLSGRAPTLKSFVITISAVKPALTRLSNWATVMAIC